MRTLRFLPLTFLAGVHGFALFAPYLAVTMTLVHVVWARRRRRQHEDDAGEMPAAAVAIALHA